jgi:hypothetical protein
MAQFQLIGTGIGQGQADAIGIGYPVGRLALIGRQALTLVLYPGVAQAAITQTRMGTATTAPPRWLAPHQWLSSSRLMASTTLCMRRS